jgi:hypothetical protein
MYRELLVGPKTILLLESQKVQFPPVRLRVVLILLMDRKYSVTSLDSIRVIVPQLTASVLFVNSLFQ